MGIVEIERDAQLKKQFQQVPKPQETRKCEKTMSGEHMMIKKNHKEPSYNESGYLSGYLEFDYKICLACGIINDLDTKE